MRLRAGFRTDIGRVRPTNEDACAGDPMRGWFVVCDGMGGEAAGEVASQLAVDAMTDRLNAANGYHADRSDSMAAAFSPLTVRLADAVRASNVVVHDHARRDPERARMGTTIVGVWVDEYIASVAHVGDSRAYLWHDGALEPLTEDHSLVEAHVRAGLLDPAARATAPHLNVLTRVLGREPEVQVDVNEVPVQPGDRLLLCSDGLNRTVDEAVIGDVLARRWHPQQVCDDLVALANQNGGGDNITVVIVDVVRPWWQELWRRSRRSSWRNG
ncbi:MAG TPA: PP2C family serine/threonine-protein phosphatase [Vicinamibacterales bacterium]|jgi:protein phosphatase